MLRFIRQSILRSKQNSIRTKYPNVSITLHPDMPSPSLNKMVGLSQTISRINDLEEGMGALSDAALREKTAAFKEHVRAKDAECAPEVERIREQMDAAALPEEKEKIKERLKAARNRVFEEILPEAFAAVREASRRSIGLRHFDVQLAGGMVLHEGKIAEMATGEGKTLVATLPAYLNALLGKGVHVITVNDYLARRDREWMGKIYEFLGLTVGVIQHEMTDRQRQEAYACDITYGTNNEFGFDYLRDNMKYAARDLVQRPFFYAIADEVDSILVDEARTPLIISGAAEESTEKYYTANKIVGQLRGRRITERDEIDAKYKGVDLSAGFDYIADEKARTVALTDEGEVKAAKLWGLDSMHSIETIEFRHHTIQALQAREFHERDVDYVVKDGKVIIVDEFTGRLMPGRRWSDGLHQAVEAKEGMKIERENQTLATITFQNYFRMYEKLAGMTGTAYTEAAEFKGIYQLDVVVLPTNKPLIRANHPDRVYKTVREKFEAVVEEIVELYEGGRPVLVGTISIDRSERLSEMLTKRGIPHQVLNAKYHEMEAQIVAQAGRHKGVTIATNMAGRGTDILLGGNPEFMARNLIKQRMQPEDEGYEQEYARILADFKELARREHDLVVSLGGLHVLGTERHEARRIDNQLRGRSGRQGDPGSSRFYVALQDDLMRLFGSERLTMIMDKLGLEDGQVIEHPWVAGSIEIAQRRVEQHNFEIRKQLLEYDNVMNKQREIVYAQRRRTMQAGMSAEDISSIMEKQIDILVALHTKEDVGIDFEPLVSAVNLKFGVHLESRSFEDASGADVRSVLFDEIKKAYQLKEESLGPEVMRDLERMVFLQVIDSKWKDHLYAMDSLREGIGLRAYGQRDPLIEYKREAFDMFGQMIDKIEEESLELLFRIQPARAQEFRGVFSSVSQELIHPEASSMQAPASGAGAPAPRENPPEPHAPAPRQAAGPKVGRNDPCPCGSGKKYKKCCGS